MSLWINSLSTLALDPRPSSEPAVAVSPESVLLTMNTLNLFPKREFLNQSSTLFMAQRLSSPSYVNFFRADYTFFPPTHFPVQLSFCPITSTELLPQVSRVSIYPNRQPVLNSDYSLWELPFSFEQLVATCFKFQLREEVLSDSLSWATCSQNRPLHVQFFYHNTHRSRQHSHSTV